MLVWTLHVGDTLKIKKGKIWIVIQSISGGHVKLNISGAARSVTGPNPCREGDVLSVDGDAMTIEIKRVTDRTVRIGIENDPKTHPLKLERKKK